MVSPLWTGKRCYARNAFVRRQRNLKNDVARSIVIMAEWSFPHLFAGYRTKRRFSR